MKFHFGAINQLELPFAVDFEEDCADKTFKRSVIWKDANLVNASLEFLLDVAFDRVSVAHAM